MKKEIVLAASALFAVGSANGGVLSASSGAGLQMTSPKAACELGEDDITQSNDCAIQEVVGIACSNGVATRATHYFRRFELMEDHGILDTYTVDGVEVGLEDVSPGTGASNPLTVNIYAIADTDDLTFANLGPVLDTATVDIPEEDDLTIISVPLNGTAQIDPNDDLVVEYVSFDHIGAGTGGKLFPGANTLGAIGPTYISAEECSVFEPTDLATLGFPDSHNVVVVNGTEAECDLNGDAKFNLRDLIIYMRSCDCGMRGVLEFWRKCRAPLM